MKLKLKLKLIPYLVITVILFTSKVFAGHCKINFNYGVVIDPIHLRIIDKGQTVVEINGNAQLFIKGKEISLTHHQQQVLTAYTKDIRKQVPNIVSIALKGIQLDLKTVNKIIGSLTGENSATHQKIQERFIELQDKLHFRFNQSAQNYYIAPQDFDDFDQIIGGDLEHDIQNIVSDSIGTILNAVSDAITKSDNNELEHEVGSASNHLKKINNNLKFKINNPVTTINNKTIQFCQNLIELDQKEKIVQKYIPALIPYNLIKINVNS